MLQQYIYNAMVKCADAQIEQGQQPPPSHTIRNIALGVGTLAAGAVAGHHLSKIPAVSDAIKSVSAKVKPLASGAAKVEADLGAATPIYGASAAHKPPTPAPVAATSAPATVAPHVDNVVHSPAAETPHAPVNNSVQPSNTVPPPTSAPNKVTPAPVTTTNTSSNVSKMVQNSAENIPSKATNGVANNAPAATPSVSNTMDTKALKNKPVQQLNDEERTNLGMTIRSKDHNEKLNSYHKERLAEIEKGGYKIDHDAHKAAKESYSAITEKHSGGRGVDEQNYHMSSLPTNTKFDDPEGFLHHHYHNPSTKIPEHVAGSEAINDILEHNKNNPKYPIQYFRSAKEGTAIRNLERNM